MRRVFVMALALVLPACAEVQTGTAEAERTVARVSPDGPISIIYRDDESNERILSGVVSYDSVLGRDRAVHFTVKNQSAEPVCDGTFTKEGPNNGKFSLSCFDGYFSGNGQYERKTGDPNNSFIAHGQTSRGLPIVLVIGRHVSRPAGNYGAHLTFVAPADSAAAGRPHRSGPAVQALEPIHEKAMPVGDTINGIQAETSIKPTGQQWPADVTAASWLHAVALRLYPQSNHAKARPRRRRGHAEATEDFAIMSDGPASASSAGKPSST